MSATDTQQVTEPVEIAPKSPQANTELDEILALIQLEIDYADTHGGCPPAVIGVTNPQLVRHYLLKFLKED